MLYIGPLPSGCLGDNYMISMGTQKLYIGPLPSGCLGDNYMISCLLQNNLFQTHDKALKTIESNWK